MILKFLLCIVALMLTGVASWFALWLANVVIYILSLPFSSLITDVIVEQGIALVAVVGRNMALKPGISAKLFSIFGSNGINIKVIAQASQELSIIVGVENSQFEKAIKAIYAGLVK